MLLLQMSATPAPWFNDLLVPVLLCDVMVSFHLLSNPFCEKLFLLLVCIAVTVAHVHFGVTVVREMADHFNIFVFSLQKPDSTQNEKLSPLKDTVDKERKCPDVEPLLSG